MNVVEVKNVSKKFGKFTALHKIDLSVKKGEVFGFMDQTEPKINYQEFC